MSLIFLVLTTGGCTTVAQNAPLVSNRVFTPTDSDRTQFVSLAHELDSISSLCTEPSFCDEIKYTKALMALFEDQETARTMFEQLAGNLPTSSIGESSASWLQVLDKNKNRDGFSNPSMLVLAQFVRESIRRNVSDIRARDVHAMPAVSEPKAREAGTLRTVQRQLKERERRIAELTAQLEALKTIDHDVEPRTRPLRAPSQVTPLYDH